MTRLVGSPSGGLAARPRKPLRGFTLIELMIVVAIVALLAVIAYPAYTNAVIKGKRSEGRAALNDLLQQQERYLTQTGSYGFNGAAIAPPPNAPASAPFKMYSGESQASSAYLLGARTCPGFGLADCVEVYATPQAPFVDAAANELYIRSTGEKGCNNATNPSVCWQ